MLTCDGSMDLCAILQFNGHCLMAKFHQKSAKINVKYINIIIMTTTNHYIHKKTCYFCLYNSGLNYSYKMSDNMDFGESFGLADKRHNNICAHKLINITIIMKIINI